MVRYVDPYPDPGVASAFANGWRQLWPNFLMLFLMGLVTLVIGSGATVFNVMSSIGGEIVEVGGSAIPIGAAFAAWGSFLSLLYGLLLVGPIEYGVKFAHLKAARNDRLDVTDMFAAFQNYWHAVLAGLLVGVIVVIGFVFLIVPGIFLWCKLAFTPYLIVDRKMGVIDAVQESWRLTSGHAGKVFCIGLLSIPIFIAGLMCLGVGVIVSIAWVRMAFASLYHAVSNDDALGADEF